MYSICHGRMSVRVTLTSSKLVNRSVKEGSSCSVIASFFTDDTDVWAAVTPTTARYRIDRINGDPSCWQEILGWTTLTPATSNTIAITGAQNAIQDNCSYTEPRQITVEANAGLDTQYQETLRYNIINLSGQS